MTPALVTANIVKTNVAVLILITLAAMFAPAATENLQIKEPL
jgi:hypothetical protein